MSSRYQDRSRDESRYSRDEPDRRDRPREREREPTDTRRRRHEDDAEPDHRSPRRDRGERERPKEVERTRSRSPKREREGDRIPSGPAAGSRYDSGRDKDDRRRGPNDDPNYRAPREDYAPPGRGGFVPRGGRGGPRGGGGGGGYGHGGRGGYGQGQGDYERPLDRRAIEEGRRRREEERAMGISHGQAGGSGDASPYPEPEAGKEGEEGEEEEVDPMASMMGFGGFGTTKGKSTGQYEGATSNVHKERTWRQYMNRRGGFNRPLDKLTK